MNYLKVGDVAAELGVSEQAVRLWCRQGILRARRPEGTRQWLIDPNEFAAWVAEEPVREVLESLRSDHRDLRADHVVVAESDQALASVGE